jgi:hypothetical protein
MDLNNIKFNRKKWIIEFNKLINNKLKEVDTEFKNSDKNEIIFHKIDLLINLLDNIEKNDLFNSKNEFERNKYEVYIDVIKRHLEEFKSKINSNISDDYYQYYPEITDKDFNQKILNKREFYINRTTLELFKNMNNSKDKGFIKSPSQKFAKTYISKQTPYNGILLWHEVGVGKTCAGIAIAENFVDFVYANKKKILVLAKPTLKDTWLDEILNIEKEIDRKFKNSNIHSQCTGDKYTNMLNMDEIYYKNKDKIDDKTFYENIKELKNQRKKIIENYYEFMGYVKLANEIDSQYQKLKNRGSKRVEKQLIDYIRDVYSNRVIIMDEVHSIRLGGSSKEDKKAIPCIELIARYAENTKFILASATPMYNVASEIIWLLNLLLWADKRAPIEEDDIFNKDGSLKEEGKSILIEKSRGYISYVRGENPFFFPIKLFPNENTYTPNPKCSYNRGRWVRIEDKNKIKQISLFKDSLSDWQYKYLLREIKIDDDTTDCTDYETNILNIYDDDEEEYDNDNLNPDNDNNIIDKGYKLNFKRLSQASNIIVPNSFGDVEVGEQVLNATFNITNNDIYTYQPHVRNIDGEPFLHRNNLYQYSAKYFNILKSIQTCQGISFVFSNFKSAGVKGLALALEANGFIRYLGKGKRGSFLDKLPKERFCSIHNSYCKEWSSTCKQASYIYIDGITPKNDLTSLVKDLNGKGTFSNTNGDEIKVILATGVAETGISFFNIREIHIMEPWFHFSLIEQVIGRGVRNNSHKELPKEKNNVTIYYHCSTLPHSKQKIGKELPDEYIYRKAFLKKKISAEVELLLKKNAVDCGLNGYSNYFIRDLYKNSNYNLEKYKIIDSKNMERTINLYDEDGSIRCGFGRCKFDCIAHIDSKINNDTFNQFQAEDDINLIKNYIKNLFLQNYVFTENQILEFVLKNNSDLADDIIWISLDMMINDKDIINDKYGKPGYIVSINGYYIFQPLNIDKDTIPLAYRYLPYYSKDKSINLTDENIISESNKIKLNLEKETEDQLENINSKMILNKFIEFDKYINKYFNDYPDKFNLKKPLIPSKYLLLCYLMFEWLEKDFSFDMRITYILDILEKIINNKLDQNLYGKYSEVDLAKFIILYYNTSNTIPFILTNSKEDINDIKNIEIKNYNFSKIFGFQTYNEDGQYILYEYINNNFEKQTERTAKYLNLPLVPFKYNDLIQSEESVLGFIGESRKKTNEFFLVNKNDGTYEIKLGKNKKVVKKNDRTGAVCGTASGGKDKIDLIRIVNSLFQFDKYDPNNKNTWAGKEELCMEIQLLLRHNDLFNPEVNKNKRYFFRIEERYLQLRKN